MQRIGKFVAIGDEAQRHRIDAVALPGRRRAVGEDVALVAVAAGAAGLDAHHAIADVAHGADVGRIDRRIEARPAGAAFELGLGAEQRQAAKAAAIDAVFLVVQQPAAERRFGAVVQEDVGLFRSEAGLQTLFLVRRRRGEVEAGVGAERGAEMSVMALNLSALAEVFQGRHTTLWPRVKERDSVVIWCLSGGKPMDITHLLLNFQGRIRRLHYWMASICAWVVYVVVVGILASVLGMAPVSGKPRGLDPAALRDRLRMGGPRGQRETLPRPRQERVVAGLVLSGACHRLALGLQWSLAFSTAPKALTVSGPRRRGSARRPSRWPPSGKFFRPAVLRL